MSTFSARATRQPVTPGPGSPRPQRNGGPGDGQPEARGRSEPKAVGAKGSASQIRAWRAAEPSPNEIAREQGRAGANGARHPFGGEAGAGPRRSTTERAARMRAIEQAWKDERARQAELDDD